MLVIGLNLLEGEDYKFDRIYFPPVGVNKFKELYLPGPGVTSYVKSLCLLVIITPDLSRVDKYFRCYPGPTLEYYLGKNYLNLTFF